MNGWEREPDYGVSPVRQWEPVAIAAMLRAAVVIVGAISLF